MKSIAIGGIGLLVAVALGIGFLMASDDEPRRAAALEAGDAAAMTWRGEWNESTEYARGNVVSLEGVSYVAEGEKLGKPDQRCAECGWALLTSAPDAAAPPPAPVTTLTSPNGSFKIEVTDTGILLDGPGSGPSSILFTGDSLAVDLPREFKVMAGVGVNVKSDGTLGLESASNAVVKSSVLTLGCAGTGSRSVARMNDVVTNGTIVSGSSKVFAC